MCNAILFSVDLYFMLEILITKTWKIPAFRGQSSPSGSCLLNMLTKRTASGEHMPLMSLILWSQP